ncbi:MAG: DUF2004 domain-containing protein [Microbacteriaceae bacterium]|nr:MAG: DUF2004 domain-containing protein [Microbacteriaceae bacterium]
MSIEHDFFGVIEDNGYGGLRWTGEAELGDQVVAIDLTADDETAIGDAQLALAAAVIRALEGFDARARDALIAQLSERESVTAQYVDVHVDTMGESLLDLLVHNSGDIPMDVLRSLQLVHVGLFPQRDADGDAFAEFDYSISPDDTEYLLVVSFDIQGDVSAVDMAS